MTFAWARLNKSVQPDELEQILVDAAKDLGYKAEVTDLTFEGYEVGSVRRVQRYNRTVVTLKKLFIPLMEVHFNRHGPNDSLELYYGLGHGLSTRGTAERYLAAVSERL